MGPSLPGVIAHRGASAYAAEHTLAAYDLALEQGADVLEIDVRLSGDGVPMVVHDRTLMRTTGDPRLVSETFAADLDRLPSGQRPLRLDFVLDRYRHSARFLVDLKEPRRPLELRVTDVIASVGVGHRVQLQCFGRQGLVRARRCAPGLSLAQLYLPALPSGAIRLDLPRVSRIADTIGPHSTSVDAALVAAAHRRGLRVQPYTVNDPVEIARLTELGVNAIITDGPDVAREAIAASRGGLVPA